MRKRKNRRAASAVRDGRIPDAWTGTDAPPDSAVEPYGPNVAGYRIIRTLGIGSRATVYLGHAPGPESDAVGNGSARTAVAVKVFHEGVSAEDIDREVAVLTSAPFENAVELIDIERLDGDHGNGGYTALVLERLASGSLSRLLARRHRLDAGEAVTILAPLYQLLFDLHERGFAHGRVSQNRVLFDESVRPVLIGFGHCSATPAAASPGTRDSLTPSRSRLTDAMAADYAQLAIIAHLILDPIAVDEARGAAHRIAEFLAAADDVREGTWLDETGALEERVFRIAPSAPVVLTGGDGTVPAGRLDPPLRFGASHTADTEHSAQEPAVEGSPRRSSGLLGRAQLSPELGDAIARIVDARPLRMARDRLMRWIAPRKKPVIVASVICASVLAAALSILPPGGEPAAGTTGGTRPTSTSSESAGGVAQPADVASTAGAADVPPAVVADDPVAATKALLELRAGCIERRSAPCLSDADQAGSALLEADRARITNVATPSTAEPLDQHVAANLIQRIGGSALVAVSRSDSKAGSAATSAPVTVLLIMGPSGWRLREIFASTSSSSG